MNKWTPGPYHCSKCGDNHWRVLTFDKIILADCGLGSKPNAQLFAAAPTLAQKLQDTVEWLNREIHNWHSAFGPDNSGLIDRLEELRDDLAETLKRLEG